jgi:hypothetical protein
LSCGGFQRRVEHFDIALAAQIREPGVEEHIHLLLEQNLLNARGDLIERRNGFAGRVLRKQNVMVVAVNLLRGDLNSLAEALLDEAQDFKPIAEIGFDPLRGKTMRGKKRLPSGICRAILTDAGGELLANLVEASVDFIRRRLDRLHVFLANLQLYEGAADQLLERTLGRERALTNEFWIENRETDFVVDVAGQDGVLVDHGDDAVDNNERRGDDGGGRVWLLGEGWRQSRKQQRKSERFRRSSNRRPPSTALRACFDCARRKDAPRCAQDDSAKQ